MTKSEDIVGNTDDTQEDYMSRTMQQMTIYAVKLYTYAKNYKQMTMIGQFNHQDTSLL